MAVDVPETEEVAFTLVSNKKYRKRKVSFLSFISFSYSRRKISLISWAFSLPKL